MIVMGHPTEWYPVDTLIDHPELANSEFAMTYLLWNHIYRPAEIGVTDEMFMRALGDFLT